jgi:O-antigen/teichoic acid export membrane protein
LPVFVVLALASKSLSRLDALGRQREKRALITDMVLLCCVGSSVVGLGVWLLRGLILSRLSLNGPVYSVIIVLLFIMAWWSPLCMAIIRGKSRFGMLSLPLIISPVVVLGLTVLFVAFWRWGLPGALFAQLSAGALWVLLFLWLEREELFGDKVRCHEEYKEIARGLFPMAVFMISTVVLMHFDRLFVRNFLTPDSGGYGAVITLGAIPGLLIVPLAYVSFPLAAAAHASGRDVQKFITHSLVIGLGVTVLCVIGFGVAGDLLLNLWRSEFGTYGKYVWVYAILSGLQGVIAAVGHVELARNESRFLWGLAVPTLGMCLLTYFCLRQIDLGGLLFVLVVTHVLILAWVLLAVLHSSRQKRFAE